MLLHNLDTKSTFPPIENALPVPDGLLCFGGDLSVKRLMKAYQLGIFPWYSNNDPILWWSPSKRMVLPTDSVHVSRSLIKALRHERPNIFINRNFDLIITTCATIERKIKGRWIHDEMISAYRKLFKLGHAFCIEVELNNQLIGGLYGVKLNNIYCGESMFSLQTNGSKFALVKLCNYLSKAGIKWLDCQIYNKHLDSMGAYEISRQEFKQLLNS